LNRLGIAGVLLAGMLLGSATFASAATLWDFVVKAEFEKPRIAVNEKPVIFGTVLNQASKPVQGAEVKIRFAGVVATTTTDSSGSFRYEFEEQNIPGTFSVSVSARINDLKGFATTTLRVGDKTSTFGDLYYHPQVFGNKTNLSDVSGDPYKALKLKHYQKFIEDQYKRKLKQEYVESKNFELGQKRESAKQQLELALKERPVGAGLYGGDEYERYIEKLDPRIKGTISGQLNYTKRIYEEAQYAMKSVLDNGGSIQEARKAYMEKLSTTKEQIIKMSDNSTENHSKIKTKKDAKINSKKVTGLKLNKHLK
jgi:hypothetical protein